MIYTNGCLILKLHFHTRCKFWRKAPSHSTQLMFLLMPWSHPLALYQSVLLHWRGFKEADWFPLCLEFLTGDTHS